MVANMCSVVYCIPCNRSPLSAHVQHLFFFHINFHIFFLLGDCHSFHIHKRRHHYREILATLYSTALKKQRAWLTDFQKMKKVWRKRLFPSRYSQQISKRKNLLTRKNEEGTRTKSSYHSPHRVLWGLNSLIETSVLCALTCKKKPRPKVISVSCLSS